MLYILFFIIYITIRKYLYIYFYINDEDIKRNQYNQYKLKYKKQK